MAKREFLMLAQTFDTRKHSAAGWYLSEKLDGMRAFWDGGISRGLLASEVPYANVEKDGRYVVPPVATGLWSRYGNVIHAPDYWLDQLPDYPLDGELYLGRGRFQELMSTVKSLSPGMNWVDVKFMVIDSPDPRIIFSDGRINTTNFKKTFEGIQLWYLQRAGKPLLSGHKSFETMFKALSKDLESRSNLQLHEQIRLPFALKAADAVIEERLFDVTVNGGEGLILRKPESIWSPERSWNLLKVKKMHDAEATVIGYTWGKETDKGSKLLGLMGSLTCRADNGVVFDLSGFTDAERAMCSITDSQEHVTEGFENPGKPVSERIHNPTFPRGSRVTFKYREHTDAGSYKEARYFRK